MELLAELDRRLADADAELAALYPGDRGVRQPVHTVYVPADRFDANTVATWAAEARAVFEQHGNNLAEAFGLPRSSAAETGAEEGAGTGVEEGAGAGVEEGAGAGVGEGAGAGAELAAGSVAGTAADLPADQVREIRERVRAKLEREPVEDLRIDFEDGYGSRPDEQEDAAAIDAARALIELLQTAIAPPYYGLRIKSLEAPTRRRGVRTLDLFLGELAKAKALTDGFVITLAKVTSVEQIEAMVLVLAELERKHGVPELKFEIQVETPQAILGSDGSTPLGRMIRVGAGRVTGLHYGTYDYSASLGIAAAYQSMEHPVADHAKDVMQLAAAGTGVFVCDGSTNVLPVGDREAVHAAWQLHNRLVRRSLARGIYQGWDMHPAQLPSRFVATCLFYREGLETAAKRLRAYVDGGNSGYLDEPATAAALAAYVLRGLESGAIEQSEVDHLIGVDLAGLAKLARRPLPDA